MTPQNDFDLSGNFKTQPFAELLTEIFLAKLPGSFRIAKGDHKTIIYFEDGEVIFAVSNARKFRFFDILLRENRIDKETLTRTPNFANDIELAAALKESGILTEEQAAELFAKQVGGIITEVLGWPDAEWTFSPLARLRSGIKVDTKTPQLLADHARSLSHDAIAFRFKSMHEMFAQASDVRTSIALEPQEAFVLSRLSSIPQTLADIRFVSGLEEKEVLKILYTLWFAGMLTRTEWNPAFSDFRISKIRNANLTLTRAAADIQKPTAKEEPEVAPEPLKVESEPEIEEISLDEYLKRVETAQSHYEILGIEQTSELTRIRLSYFALAKMFHPDRFHRAEPEVLRRVENAFSKLAQAHEALRDPKTRTTYDNQLRRDLADKKLQAEEPMKVNVQGNQLNAERAGQEFEHGRGLLSEGEHEEALPFLARAVHLAANVASYHAFYGKALSFTDNGRHKAEAEMQAAIKLEPNNATYRMMLVEFFINVKLVKRAEGELGRLLAAVPDHKEARALLDSLRQK